MRGYKICTCLVGIILILLSTILEVTYVPTIDRTVNDLKYNCYLIATKVFSAIGISLFVGFLTSLVRKTNEQKEEYMKIAKGIYISDVAPLIEKSLENLICNPSTVTSLNDDAKLKLIQNCLHKNNQMDEYKFIKINNLSNDKLGFRSGAMFTGKAYIGEGIVKLSFTIKYKLHKGSSTFEPEYTYCSEESSTMESIKFTNPNNSNDFVEINKNSLTRTKSAAHGTTLEYVVCTEIPEKFNSLDEIMIEKKVVFKGKKHWIVCAWTNLLPTQGFNMSISCQDDLFVKEANIFDASDIYTINPSNLEKTPSTTYNASTTRWVGPHTGFAITIGKGNND